MKIGQLKFSTIKTSLTAVERKAAARLSRSSKAHASKKGA